MSHRPFRRLALALAVPLLVLGCSAEPKVDPSRPVTIAFGSCADEGEHTARTWAAILAADPDAMVTLGDTPYIDSTDLDHQRKRYAEFAAAPGMAEVCTTRAWLGVWDDHDFGRNDTDGNLAGKENSRTAFIETHNRVNGWEMTYGNGAEGIYRTFRMGDVQVFLLDTRWFAATEPSPFDADAPTLLGADQWDWLRETLLASDAPFKVLACGMIWNGAVRPGKQDHWGTYPHEFEALMRFIGENQVGGVVLVGGDIHRSRCIVHDTADAAGYDIPEFITSPMHVRIIDAANQPHPGLAFDAGAPNSFLLLETTPDQGDGPTLTARFLAVPPGGEPGTPAQTLYTLRQTAADLAAQPD